MEDVDVDINDKEYKDFLQIKANWIEPVISNRN